jgi:hypothetical protein
MNRVKKCVGLLVCCALLVLAAALSGCGQVGLPEGMGHYCGPTELMMNGQIYHDAGTTRLQYAEWDSGPRVFRVDHPTETVLPEGYIEYGPTIPVEHKAEKDGEMAAGFEGTIYTSETTPEVVYILGNVYDSISKERKPQYVRFVSETLRAQEDTLYWQGALYREAEDYGGEVLPAGLTEVGKICYVGWDALPRNDLETNAPSYGSDGGITDGCTVYADPADDTTLYVQITVWRDGEGYLTFWPWEKTAE